MEGSGGGMSFESGNHVARKRRSFASRRPRTDRNFFSDCRDFVSVSSADAENSTIYAQPGNTEFDGRTPDEAGGSLGYGSEFRRSSEGVLAPANWNSGGKKIRVISEVKDPEDHLNGADGSHLGHTGSTVNGSGIPCEMGSNGSPQEGKLKVKLKVGGVTHTIHTKPAENLSGSRRTSPTNLSKPPRSSDSTRRRYKLVLSDNSDDAADQSSPDDGLQGLQWKGNKALSSSKVESRGKISVKSSDRSSNASAESARKSRRVPKRRALDQDFDDDDDDDDEIRYLERLKTSKANADNCADYDDEYQEDGSHKQRSSRTSKKRISINDFGNEPDYDTGSCKGNTKRVRSRDIDGLSNADDEDNTLDNEDDDDADDFGSGSRRKKQKKEFIDKIVDERKDIPLTTRQRALKDPSSRLSSSLIEFPNGLPPAASKKQKEKLTDVEQQLKKAEAAQRRRMQVEKNTRELEALAIRKILGQDANGKKKGEKSQKRREGLAQERAARELELAASSIRLVMGPTGTVVSFPKNSGLPSIFGSKISSYPPPREKCAGPACTNTFKYRDSVSKLPLCSLQCYRAIHKTMEPLTFC